jgi:hypothetical protein
MTDNIRPGDRIITDTAVTYTAVDFEGNTETCSVQFNIISMYYHLKFIYNFTQNSFLDLSIFY